MPSRGTPNRADQRQRLRKQGLRLIEIWVSDTRSEAFAAAA
ncbi:antitoxin MazE-like protein, partial [Vulcanococcus sp.]